MEAIRNQNYREKKAIRAGLGNQVNEVPNVNKPPVGDPRYDPEARKKKIEALKVGNWFVVSYVYSLLYLNTYLLGYCL